MTGTLLRSPIIDLREESDERASAGPAGEFVLRLTGDPLTATARHSSPSVPVTDIVDEWGRQSFPASDPPANW